MALSDARMRELANQATTGILADISTITALTDGVNPGTGDSGSIEFADVRRLQAVRHELILFVAARHGIRN